MNEINQNAFQAILISMLITLPLLFFSNNLIEIEREKFMKENNCYDENVVCDWNAPLQFLLLPISIMIYYLFFKYFENKRKKTWRSYN